MFIQSDTRHGGWMAICTIAALVPWSQVHAGRAIEERRAADPQGEIEIVNVAGKVQVDGWDRSEVEVSGTAGEDVERVDVTTAGSRTTIHVTPRSAHSWGADGGANLVVHVPVKCSLTATLVSADFSVTGVMGNLKLQSVSGNLTGDAGSDLRASTVSGDVRLAGRGAKEIEVKTISGDIRLTGGGGDVDVATVSGAAVLDLADVSRARFKSVSGDMTVALALVQGGRIEAESVSGGISLRFAATPAAEFDVQSFSGNIRNCFGPTPVESQYGPGSRLQFTNGEGHGRVHIDTKNGDVKLCVKGGHAAMLPVARLRSVRWAIPYVY